MPVLEMTPAEMDFGLGETQQVIARSAAEVLGAAAPDREAGIRQLPPAASEGPGRPGRARVLSAADHGTAGGAWLALAKAGLLALTLPGWMGGDDLGILEAAVLLTEIGRQGVAAPALATIMLGALPVARWGGRDLQELLLDGVSTGDTILTAAVRERSTVMPARPATVASLRRSSGTVTGVKVGVPYAGAARWILVPASLESGGTAVVVVSADADGVSALPAPTASGQPESTVRLDEAAISGVLGTGRARAGAVADLYRLSTAGACAMADGALAGALELTTAHVATRHQFGRPLAAFQAVAQQIADVYLAGRTLHLATLSACWRLAAGRDADEDLDVAAFWLAEEAVAAVRTCHHLHGGIGLDVSYPLHRYSSMIMDLVRSAGGAEGRLDALGARAGC